MAKLKAVIANIEIDAGDDPGSISTMLGAALAGFTGQRVETVEVTRAETPKLVHEGNGHVGEVESAPVKRQKKFSRRVELPAGKRQSSSANADKIEAYLRSINSVSSMAEIIAGSGVPRGSVESALKDPRFRKVGRGEYDLASRPKQAASATSLADRIAALLKMRHKLDTLTISKELRIDRQEAVDAMNEDEARFEMDAAGLWSLV